MSQFKILVVDDEKDLAEIMVESLEMEGFTAVECHDGTEALKLFQNEVFHGVLCDSNMPGMKGLDLLEKIRELSSTSEHFLFYLCTGDMALKESEVEPLGIKRLILKPYDLFSTIEVIKKDLNDHFIEKVYE